MSRKSYILFSIFLSIVLFFLIYFNLSRYALFLVPGIIISTAGLYVGGELFLDEAVNAGKAFRISHRATGIYFVSAGAIIDEIVISILAAARGQGGISFGTIQGSNIITLFFFLVVIPLIYRTGFKGFRLDSVMLIILMTITIIASFYFTKVPWEFAIVLFALFAVYLYVVRDKTEPSFVEENGEPFQIIPAILSIILIILASDEIVTYAQSLSLILNVPSFVSGFFVTGVGGSLPELIMVMLAVRRGGRDITTGIITGSTIYKSSLVLAIATLFGTIYFTGTQLSIYFMLLLSFVLLFYTMFKVKKFFSFVTIAVSVIFIILYVYA